jgi:hypothetical protein
MKKSQGQRARRLGEKAARRKAVVAEKRKAEIAASAGGLGRTVKAAATGPIHACLLHRGLFVDGIGQLIVARSLPSGHVAAALFLVDAFCLGVKDVFFREMTAQEFADVVEGLSMSMDLGEYDPACARKLVRDAVSYAAELGFPPPKDFAAIEPIFGDLDAAGCAESFTFGKDGKPYFIAGPHDTPQRARVILQTLERTQGPGGYEYMIPV